MLIFDLYISCLRFYSCRIDVNPNPDDGFLSVANSHWMTYKWDLSRISLLTGLRSSLKRLDSLHTFISYILFANSRWKMVTCHTSLPVKIQSKWTWPFSCPYLSYSFFFFYFFFICLVNSSELGFCYFLHCDFIVTPPLVSLLLTHSNEFDLW